MTSSTSTPRKWIIGSPPRSDVAEHEFVFRAFDQQGRQRFPIGRGGRDRFETFADDLGRQQDRFDKLLVSNILAKRRQIRPQGIRLGLPGCVAFGASQLRLKEDHRASHRVSVAGQPPGSAAGNRCRSASSVWAASGELCARTKTIRKMNFMRVRPLDAFIIPEPHPG